MWTFQHFLKIITLNGVCVVIFVVSLLKFSCIIFRNKSALIFALIKRTKHCHEGNVEELGSNNSNKKPGPKYSFSLFSSCYVMLWPALTWRGQEWAQHIQGQLLDTCITQMAGSHHVMELPLTVYKCRASLVKLLSYWVHNIRTVLCVVRIKLQKEIIYLRVLLYCMTKSYPLEQFPHP